MQARCGAPTPSAPCRRSSTADELERLVPPRILSLEQALEFCRDAECVEDGAEPVEEVSRAVRFGMRLGQMRDAVIDRLPTAVYSRAGPPGDLAEVSAGDAGRVTSPSDQGGGLVERVRRLLRPREEAESVPRSPPRTRRKRDRLLARLRGRQREVRAGPDC